MLAFCPMKKGAASMWLEEEEVGTCARSFIWISRILATFVNQSMRDFFFKKYNPIEVTNSSTVISLYIKLVEV